MTTPTGASTDISPAECIKAYLEPLLDAAVVPAGAVVGPGTDAQQQAGVLSIVDAGMPVVEKYVPVIWIRAQFRAIAGTLEQADRIAEFTRATLAGTGRQVVTQPSTGEQFLIHMIVPDAGPSHHYDSPETWEALFFASVMMGSVPVGP